MLEQQRIYAAYARNKDKIKNKYEHSVKNI